MKDFSVRGNPFFIFINSERSPAWPGGIKPYPGGSSGYPGAGKMNTVGTKIYPVDQEPYPFSKK
jgi:hypothetical protein